MVQVTVSDHERFDFVFAFFEIGGVWDYIVNTRSINRTKSCSRIDNNDLVVVFNQGHVFLNFLYTSDWNDTNITWGKWGNNIVWFFSTRRCSSWSVSTWTTVSASSSVTKSAALSIITWAKESIRCTSWSACIVSRNRRNSSCEL